jgi:hypothetical protein
MAELSVAMEAGAPSSAYARPGWMPRTASGRRPVPRTRLRPWPARAVGKPTLDFGLVDDDVIEGKIIASRLGAAVVEGAGSEWNDLRLRMKRLERGDDLASDDPLRPEVLAQALLKAWTDQGLTRPMWALVHAGVQTALAQRYKEAYIQANAFLQQQGIAAELELRTRRPAGPGGAAAPGRPPGSPASSGSSGSSGPPAAMARPTAPVQPPEAPAGAPCRAASVAPRRRAVVRHLVCRQAERAWPRPRA